MLRIKILGYFLEIVRIFKSSLLEVLCKKGDPKNSAKITGNICTGVSLIMKLQVSWQLYFKKRLRYRFFSENLGKFFRRLILENISTLLLLNIVTRHLLGYEKLRLLKVKWCNCQCFMIYRSPCVTVFGVFLVCIFLYSDYLL